MRGPAKRAIDLTPGLSAARQDALIDALTRALRLAEQLPSGHSEDEVRRAFCHLIEATEGAGRAARVERVLSSIAQVRRTQAQREPRVDRADAGDIERFASVVRTEVLPLLAGPDH